MEACTDEDQWCKVDQWSIRNKFAGAYVLASFPPFIYQR